MWPFPPKPAAARRARKRAAIDFSLAGLLFACVMLLLGLAAIHHTINLLYGVFGLMVGILLVAWAMSKRVLRRLTVRRTLPDHAVVGVPAHVEYRFENGKRFWPSMAVTVAELDGSDGFAAPPRGYLLHAPARSGATVRAEVTPARRGVQVLDRHQLQTSFPFGFVKRAVTLNQPDRLLVYPPLGQVDRAVLAWCRSAETNGAPVRPRQGGHDEFFGVKEHRPGDNPRLIHWKRSARTAAAGLLVAREMTRVAPPRLVLLVDTWLTDKTLAEREAVERAVAMAASLAARALEEDLSVGLLAWSDGWQRVEPSRGKRHRSDLLSALARLPLNVTHDTAQLLAQASRNLRDGATGILFTPRSLPAGPDPAHRGAVVALPAGSDEAKRWFHFDPKIDFAAVGPVGNAEVGMRGAESRNGAGP